MIPPCRRSRTPQAHLVVILPVLLAALLDAAPTPALAQQEERTEREREARETEDEGVRLQAEVKVEGLVFDNFFQAPEGRPQDNVFATRVLGRLEASVDPDLPLVVFGEVGRTFWDDFDDGLLFGGGVRYSGEPHSLDAYLGRLTEQPILDVGDELDVAGVTRFDGEYGYRASDDWEPKLVWEYARQEFDLTPSKDNDIYGVGPAVRYRGFGYGFSPEVGLLVGNRDVENPAEDHSQRDLYVKVRSVPAPELYLSFRYRFRTRDYSIEEPGARNLGREDNRQSLTALAVLETGEHLVWHAYYTYQNAESTLASRTFTNQLLIFGLAVRF